MKEDTTYRYSRWVGSIYTFNLIVGTGALAMPKAFQDAGWLLSGIVLALLCFLSYVTMTYVIEAMSISNGLWKLTKLKYAMQGDDFTQNEIDDDVIKTMHPIKRKDSDERQYGTIQGSSIPVTPSQECILLKEDQNISFFEITETFEMGEMAIKYFNKAGLVCFYLSMCIYLYGDLAVYAAVMPTSLRDIACTYQINLSNWNSSSNWLKINASISNSDPCWPNSSITRINAYRIFLTIFMLLLCPFIFFNLTKTKFLQITTLSMRWFSFGIMIVLMSIYLGQGNKYGQPHPVDITHSPNLFGICVYAFMCHHSLPSLITPISDKRRLYTLLFGNFLIILCFYFCLNYLAIFTFKDLKSLITLNFDPIPSPGQPQITTIAFFQYYLMLFPVFSLSSSFPIIGITLRNNLKNLVTCGTGRNFNNVFLDRFMYPLLAIIPPILVVYATDNIQMLVGFTGSYAGSMIQYLIPISLVWCARKQLGSFLSKMDDNTLNSLGIEPEQLDQLYQSPFRHMAWAIVIAIWTVISIVFVTVNHIKGS